MRVELQKLERYLQETLGIKVAYRPWRGGERLPHLLKEHYTYAEITVLGTRCLLMVDAHPDARSPAILRKHLDLLRQKSGDAAVVYVRRQVTAYNRKRLIEQKVPFIVPGNQLYLPMLGLDLREHFKGLHSERRTLSPATQALVIHALLRDPGDILTPTMLAKRLKYSPMTLTRAFDELEALKLGEISVNGRERRLRFSEKKRDLWTKAEPLMRSPVTTRHFIQRFKPVAISLRAGLSALAEYSMLAPPAHAVLAVSRPDWKSLRQRHKTVMAPDRDADAVELEVWSYRPALFSDEDRVDPLSLYLSLRGTNDERVESALDEMMRKLPW